MNCFRPRETGTRQHSWLGYTVVLLFWFAPFAYGQGAEKAPSDTNTAARASQTEGSRIDSTRESNYDKIWQQFTQWYRDDQNPVVQQVLFSGRYQHEFAAIDADEGDHDEWNVRRMRLG